MNALVLILIAALVACPVYAEQKKKESGLTKVLRTMFPSATPKIIPRKKKHVAKRPPKAKPSQTPSVNQIYVTVEIDWMAKYWEQEAAWDYYLPEDNQIRFVDGKYQVPIVVFRHYEDMVKTPRRTPTPKPVEPLL